MPLVNRTLHLFVYGTLKREQPNHFWMTDTNNGFSKFLGDGRTVQQYPLVIATKYNIPFLLFEPGVGNRVSGEVFSVDEKMLGRLDILEEHPIFYERLLEPIEMEFADKPLECWTYFLKEYKKELLGSQTYERYDSKGVHGLPYCERPNRDLNYDYKSAVK